MIKISVDRLEPGMRLAKPVQAANGMVLFSEGTELNSAWVERLQDMNLEAVYIEGKLSPTIAIEDALDQLEQRFRNVQDKPYMDILKRAVQKHIEGLYE